jgi:UDP-N-acetylglucosamine--N-acetylmuramyl-(pentapeptide) pyrophosphoryl-undecaprenol N-acetylglucosamine transferase
MTAAGVFILLAAGGTGGHMFPAEALAEELVARGHRVALVTDARGKGFGDRQPVVDVHRISAAGIAGRGLAARARGALLLLKGWFQARALLRRLRPAVVVGFGGYASVPTVMAAQRAGIRTVLHEQNAVLGRANRLLARQAAKIATSFDQVAGLPGVSGDDAVVTGNPVRPAIAAVADSPYPAFDGDIHLLILGGSQGARVFSQVVPAAIAMLPEPVRARLRLAQQCRAEDYAAVKDAYDRLGIAADLATFFADVPQRLAKAHLAITRSGASTVAELCAAGRPAILVPYPSAADDHQSANARAAEAAGAAWTMAEPGFTPEALATRLDVLLAAPATLAAAAAHAREAGRRDAAARLADLVGGLVTGTGQRAGAPAEAPRGADRSASNSVRQEAAA